MSAPSVPSPAPEPRSGPPGVDPAQAPALDPPLDASGAAPLRQQLREEVAASTLAFDAAALRCDRALACGDHEEVAAALDEQRAVMADTERRLSRAVARAVEERAHRDR